MLSSADKVDGQGVGSAYQEQVNLLKEGASDLFDIYINDKKTTDILHHHTLDLKNYRRLKQQKSINVVYVHFLPTTLDGSIKLPRFAFGTFKKYVTKFYNKADYLVVVNPIFINELVSFGIAREKIKYIPNYVSKKQFYKLDQQQCLTLRQQYGYTKDDFIVMGAGQVQTRKGVADFIKVAKSLPHIKFVWCGGFSFGRITDGYHELKEIYENPPKNVNFLGIVPREQMNQMFNMADVLFMPSYNELFPMAILEAVNSEKPLLLRNLELYEEILFKKYLCANVNEDFKSLLEQLSQDPLLYQKYSQYAKEISEFYSKEHVLSIWKEFYQTIYQKHKHTK